MSEGLTVAELAALLQAEVARGNCQLRVVFREPYDEGVDLPIGCAVINETDDGSMALILGC